MRSALGDFAKLQQEFVRSTAVQFYASLTKAYVFSGWWLTYPSEKYESQLGSSFPIYGKHVRNHQPVLVGIGFN
jgi:hypothetical protein